MIRLKDIVRFTLSFLLMFVLILTQMSMFVNSMMLDGDFYRDALKKSYYFSLMRKDIDFSFKNLSAVVSIPEDVFINSVKDDEIVNLSDKNITFAEQYMRNINSQYEDSKYSSAQLQTNVKKYAEDYAQKNKIKLDANFQSQIQSVIDDSAAIVQNHAVLFNIGAVEKYPQFQKFRKVINMFSKITGIWLFLIVSILVLLYYLNMRRPRRIFLWAGSSFIPASLMMLVPPLLALYYKIPYKFAIEMPYLKIALTDITLGYIWYFIKAGIVHLAIGISSLCIFIHLSNKAAERRRMRRQEELEDAV